MEVSGTACMKLSNGFTRLWPSIGVLVFYLSCFAALTLAVRTIPLSTAYAIWCGVGIVLIAGIGILFFDEPVSWVKILGIGLIVCGVVILNLTSQHE